MIWLQIQGYISQSGHSVFSLNLMRRNDFTACSCKTGKIQLLFITQIIQVWKGSKLFFKVSIFIVLSNFNLIDIFSKSSIPKHIQFWQNFVFNLKIFNLRCPFWFTRRRSIQPNNQIISYISLMQNLTLLLQDIHIRQKVYFFSFNERLCSCLKFKSCITFEIFTQMKSILL